ncbi:hypothetical protein M514_12785 [Trichuris suis]|uniref:Uncharacterized protein n=1 Tax=Trichuris suis TaxID=68888 RepID=A0A085NHY4_9BILA|nr:hypothetical protein M513_12785 [Trichuris suis]KFD69080.1 hypothetical protein M514_12785 [Trichuris suis]
MSTQVKVKYALTTSLVSNLGIPSHSWTTIFSPAAAKMLPKFIAMELIAVCATCTILRSNGLHFAPNAALIQQANRLRDNRLYKRQIPVDPVLQQAAMASRMVPTVAALEQPNLWGLWKARIPPIPIIPAEMMPINYPQPLALQLPNPPGQKRRSKLPMPTAVDYVMLNIYITSKLEELQMRVLRIEDKLEKLEQPAFLSWSDGRTN